MDTFIYIVFGVIVGLGLFIGVPTAIYINSGEYSIDKRMKGE